MGHRIEAGCWCGKIRYQTRRKAKRAGRELRGKGYGGGVWRAYRCGEFWHLTTQDTATITRYREA